MQPVTKRRREPESAFRPSEVTPVPVEQQRDIMSATVVKVVTDEQQLAMRTLSGALDYFEKISETMPARRETERGRA